MQYIQFRKTKTNSNNQIKIIDNYLNFMENSFAHQSSFRFSKVSFDSRFASGNLARVEEVDPSNYSLWIGSDPKSTYRTWFHFSVEGVEKKRTVTFTIKNMSNQAKIYKEGLVPVFKEGEGKWERGRIPVQAASIVHTTEGLELQFKHNFESQQKVYFAFTYPWTREDWDGLAGEFETYCKAKNIYCQRSVLTNSLQNRLVEILTVTKNTEQEKQELVNDAHYADLFKTNPPRLFPKKKGVFISSRVHPGEVPSSHIFNGIVKSLMTESQETDALLQQCVLYLVPFLNPDGVDKGLYRSNSQGQNLNRHYLSPNELQHPQIFHTKKLIDFLSKNTQLKCCLDLHAHAAKKGCFIYGNSIPDLKKQVEVCLFPKIMSLNNQDFDYDACNFSEANMYQTDKGDNLSKEGAARVGLYKSTNLHTCWTLEVNYNTGKIKNKIPNRSPLSQKFNINSMKKGVIFDYFGEETYPCESFYTIESFQNMGRSIIQSFADYFQLTPTSRIHSAAYKNIQTLKLNLSISILRMVPFKFDQGTRKILQKLLQQQTLFETLRKVHVLIDSGNPSSHSRKSSSIYKTIVTLPQQKSTTKLRKPSLAKISNTLAPRKQSIALSLKPFR